MALVAAGAPIAACSGADVPGSSDPDAAPSTTSTLPPPSSAPPPGADAAPSVSDGGGADAGPYCEFRVSTCGRSAAGCNQERTCFAAMRAGAGALIESCVLSRKQCNQVDDCMETEIAKHIDEPGPKAFRAACETVLSSCNGSNGIDDGDCTTLALLPDPTLAVMKACFSKPCAMIGTCVSAEAAKYGCD